jgi:hypothetical protein
MNDNIPTYMSNKAWAGLLSALRCNEALQLQMGVKHCPFTGKVEEYTMVDQLGGMFDVWPAKWRSIIEAETAA